MKYAAITYKIVDFDISRGNTYEDKITYFEDEQKALEFAVKNPSADIIRYETVKVGFNK